ncbi:MAG: hypothetical protein AAFY26_14165 [Cyanobacteria bacterium J06638_22]
MNDWLNVILVLSALLGLMLGLRVWQRARSPNSELVRKLVHIPMGLLTLSFPWLFTSPWSVTVLGSLAIGFLVSLRLVVPLAKRLGKVLGSVERRSLGEVYFTISIVTVFWMSSLSDVPATEQRLLFIIPMLILTLADAVAALIGVRYGQTRYTTDEGFKSAEGSLAFFMVAFFSVHIPLLLFSTTGRAETLMIAIILGLLVMLLEAIAWRGLDNLFIPMGSFLLLNAHLTMTISELVWRLVATVLLVLLGLAWRPNTTLNDSAILGVAFVGYIAWMLGGFPWLLPPLLLFLTYPWFVPWTTAPEDTATQSKLPTRRWFDTELGPQPGKIHTVVAVLSVSAAGLLWLVLASLEDGGSSLLGDRPPLLYPYTLAYAVNLALIGVAGISSRHYWKPKHWFAVARFSLQAWLIVSLPMLVLVFGVSTMAGLSTLLTFPLVWLAAIAFFLLQLYMRRYCNDVSSFICRAIFSTLFSILGYIPIMLLHRYL